MYSYLSQVIWVECVIIHEIQSVAHPLLFVIGYLFKEVIITVLNIAFRLYADFIVRRTYGKRCNVGLHGFVEK